MKYKTLWKDATVEIRKSFGRFMSIFFIVAIGVAFFAGITASAPSMKYSADAYFDEQNLMDVKVMTTMGLDNNDINALQDIDGVEGVYPSHSLDALVQVNASQLVTKVISYPMNAKESDKEYINQPRIIEGRLPTKENECALDYDKMMNNSIKIGEEITLLSGDDTPLSEQLKNETFTVVGYITSPYYLSHEKGSSSIGGGVVSSFIIIDDSNFISPYYTEAYLSVEGSKAYNAYDDEGYFTLVEKVTNKIKKQSTSLASVRVSAIKKEAEQTLFSKEEEYKQNESLFTSEINNAKLTLTSKQNELNANKQKLEDGQKELNNQKNMFESNKVDLEIQKQTLQTQLNTINQSITQVQQALQNTNLDEQQRLQLEGQLAQLTLNKRQVEEGLQTIITTLSTTPSLIASKKAELDQAKIKIQEGQIQLDATNNELSIKESDGKQQLASASEQIQKAKEDIDAIEAPEWYILDRHSHYSFMDYGSAADRMGAVATVFPIFFFLVAALVCLTSMTRMVDEHRQEIGTLKALGYTKSAIALKYVSYAGIASVLGGIFGAIIGMAIFPTVIYTAWNIMYTLPENKLQWQWDLATIAIVLASLITIGTTLLACYKELSETPSLLMRPKPPKNGKKIFLERISFIWKHFTFTHKVTARNIFRYKKRFLMTVLGISGCSALIVAGFGIRDSIKEIVPKQFGEIYKYDVSISLDNNLASNQVDTILSTLKNDASIKESMPLSIYHGFYADAGEDKGVDLYVFDDPQEASNFYSIRNRNTHEVYDLQDDGVYISEKLSKDKNLSINDTFKVDNGDGKKLPLKINGIVENYVGNNMYMTPTYYQKIYKEKNQYTTIVSTFKQNTKDIENNFGNAFMQIEEVKSVTFFSGYAATFDNTISSLIIVVFVLIISAGILAFIVLYNLTTVNISERTREIATIKVLGFYDKEVSSYVYRENIVLTIIGSLCGLGLGIILHLVIMDIAEMDNIMFGRNIEPTSYILAFLITMAFSIIVNLVMYKKLCKIPMVESLKSVE